MTLKSNHVALLAVSFGTLLAPGAVAQEFPDVQTLTNRVLFTAQDAAVRRQEAETRRVEALSQRAQDQAVLLQQQAASVRQLGSDLALIRSERELLEVAQSFDAAVAAGSWQAVRSLLVDSVMIDLGGQQEATAGPISADAFVSSLQDAPARNTVLPRSNQHVRIAGEQATLVSDGYAWGRASRAGGSAGRPFGTYQYHFVRTADLWKLDGLSFRPSVLSG